MHNLITEFWPSTVDGLTLGSIYALIALGYTMVYGVLSLINFAHSEVFMMGTLGSLFMIHALGVTGPQTGFALIGVLLASLVAAMAASAVTALVLERVAYRPLRRRGASRLAALISAIGASFFLQEFVALRYGRDLIPFPRVMAKQTLFHIGTASVRNDKLIVIMAAIALMVLLDRFVNGTRLGRGIRATAQDPETAVLMGVNIDRVVVATFVLGGMMAGVAAMLYGLRFENTQYIAGFVPGIKAFTAAVLGGIGNLRGALLGGLVLGLVESYGASVFGSQWLDIVAFSVLVIVLLFRPTGILGEALTRART
ncbi:MAG TPA: branched-chain amino acid ABC transporter permease [Acidimicrobiales bacterium]|jgi:branched-chain amino acid transport system permease protein|nr:branched-chain amino acid ABC transporter permease [Acidimicrobiales bacterium]